MAALTYHPSGARAGAACRVPTRGAVPREARLRAARRRSGAAAVLHPGRGGRPGRRPAARPDFRTEVWPLIAKELTAAHYRRLFAAHPGADPGSLAGVLRRPGHGRCHRRAPSPTPRSRPFRSGRTASIFRVIDRPLAGRSVRLTPTSPTPSSTTSGRTCDRRRGPLLLRRRGGFRRAADGLRGAGGRAHHRADQRRSTGCRYVEGEFHGFFSFLASGPPPRRLAELLALHGPAWCSSPAPSSRSTSSADGFRRHHPRPCPAAMSGPAPWSTPDCPDRTSGRPPTRSSASLLAAGELAAEELTGPDGRPAGGRAAAGRRELPGDPRRRIGAPTAVPARARPSPAPPGRPASPGPASTGPGFRQNDAVARQILRLLQAPDPSAVRLRLLRSIATDQRSSIMPVEFLGIAGTNTASEVTPRTGRQPGSRLHPAAGPGPRGQRLGPHPVRLPLRLPGPGRRSPPTSPGRRSGSIWCWRIGRMSRLRPTPPRPSPPWTTSRAAGSRCISSPAARPPIRPPRATTWTRTPGTTGPGSTSRS